MSGHGVLLPLPDDRQLEYLISAGLGPFGANPWPRSAWLRLFEDVLQVYYPASSSRDRSLTARHYAPFPLAAGPDVP